MRIANLRRLFAGLATIATSTGILSGQTRTSVVVRDDPRAEVLSIMFHLAGAGEYNGGVNKLYVRRMDSAFAPFRDHAAITEINRLRKSTGVGFEAVMSMAAHITDPFTFAERAPIDAARSSLSGRWRGANARPLLQLSAQFSKDANMAAFLKLSQPLFDTATVRMKRFVDQRAHLEWLSPYFTGVASASYFLSPVIGNSGGAYSTRFDDGNTHELHAFIGIHESDTLGFPVVSGDFLPVVIHEFTHSFVNSVVGARSAELKESGERVYKSAQAAMNAGAYTSAGTMLNESVVRAGVIRYLLANDGPAAAAKETRQQRGAGFIWMPELASLFETYEANRKQYPTLASFMPRIIEYYNGLAPRIDSMTAEFGTHRPSITGATIADSAVIEPSTTEITVRFSRAMGDGPSMDLVGGTTFPEILSYGFNADKTAFTFKVKLTPNTAYGMRYTGAVFSSADGYPLNSYTIRFRTR
ncbi:MAG: DUF4932 domain-containing protein [Phycisphaerae bacterium]|nr:DUF4932 domain-containing protein [Gemmatimonadaceae bacterium]